MKALLTITLLLLSLFVIAAAQPVQAAEVAPQASTMPCSTWVRIEPTMTHRLHMPMLAATGYITTPGTAVSACIAPDPILGTPPTIPAPIMSTTSTETITP